MPFFLFAKFYRNRPAETIHGRTPDTTLSNNKAHQHACMPVAKTFTQELTYLQQGRSSHVQSRFSFHSPQVVNLYSRGYGAADMESL